MPAVVVADINDAGGLCFIAHPKDPAAPAFNETDISWEAWDVRHYTGIELWNGLSELKTVIPTKLHGAFYAFFPQFIGHHPMYETLQRWDDLLVKGRRVVAIGGITLETVAVDAGYGALAGALVGAGISLIDQGSNLGRNLMLGAGAGILVGAAVGAIQAYNQGDRVASDGLGSPERDRLASVGERHTVFAFGGRF